MKKKTDEYCEKIFVVLSLEDENIRFNQLHRKLATYGAKMSKPTLIEHLNHLVKDEVVQRVEIDKQYVSYGLNWKKLQQIAKVKDYNKATPIELKNEKRFKSKNLREQIIDTTAFLTIGELFYLKLMILDILEPENKLYNYLSYTWIRKFYNRYATWLVDSCKESKENSEKVLDFIERSIKKLIETVEEIPQSRPQKPEGISRMLKEF